MTVPSEVKYAPIPFAPGAEFAYMASNGSKPENYTLRVHLKPDAKMPPHTHPDTRIITVLSGEVFVGTGTKFDPDNGTLLPTGSFFVMPAGTIHWSWAKTGDVTYQESGTGPTATVPVSQ
jgi:quercetin dioxygenase-like cupin family protein